MKNIFITLIFLTSILYTINAQTILYSEDFSGQVGKGVVGPQPITFDTSGVTWTIDSGNVTLTANTDYFKVNSSESFESKDVDGEVVWYSPITNISTVTAVDLSVDIAETGNLASTEYIRVYYVLDGGVENLFSLNGDNTDDFNTATASHDSLFGSTIQIIIKTYNNAGTKTHTFDNLTITENISNVQNLYDLPQASSISLKWTDPASAFDEVLIVANENTPLSAGTPTGDGSSYTANSILGTGTAVLGGTVIYKGSGDSTNFTGVTNVNDYYIKVFTRTGTTWSKGMELKVYYNPPVNGSIFITEHARHKTITEHSYLELHNNTSADVNLSGAKIVSKNASSISKIIDLRSDIPQPVIIPANGFLILNRDRSQSNFEASAGWGIDLSSLGHPVNYIRTGEADFGKKKFFQLKFSGNENTNDGVLIDESTKRCLANERVFQLPLGYWNKMGTPADSATPGYIANYEDLFHINIVYNDGSWYPNAPSSSTSTQNAAVISGNAPFVDGSSLNELTIWGGAGTDISNESITVSDSLIIKNNASVSITGTGSLTGANTTKVERKGYDVNSDYNIWGTPFNTLLDLQTVFPNANPCDMYVFKASTQEYKYDFTVGSSITCTGNVTSTILASHVIGTPEGTPDGKMDIGRGYFIPGNISNTISFNTSMNDLNNGTINTPLFGSSGSVVGGSNDWNLISNPYPSAISANDFITANMPLITNAIYVYNQGLTSSSFSTYNSTDGFNIASCQGFFVDADTNINGLLGTVNFTNSMRNNQNSDFRSTNSIHSVYLSASNSQNQKDVMRIYFDDNAKEGFDRLYDANKMMGSQFNLASRVSEHNLVFNGVPELTVERKIIPLFFNTTVSGTYQISIDSLIGDFTGKDIILEDRILRTFHDLRVNSYSFSTDVNNWDNRFFLHIQTAAGPTGIKEATNLEVLIIAYENEILVTSNNSDNVISMVQVLDMKGQIIQTKNGNSNSVRIRTTGMATGVYLVKYLLNNESTGIRKLVIR